MVQEADVAVEKHESLLEWLQRMWPLSGYQSKKEAFTVHEFLFVYYGIEPTEENPYFLIRFEQFCKEGDVDSVWPLMIDSMQTGSLVTRGPRAHPMLLKEELIVWLKQKELNMPKAFLKMGEVEEANSSKRRGPKKEGLRRDIARAAATIKWKVEKEEMEKLKSTIKKYSTPTEMARKSDMVELIKGINKMGQLSPINQSDPNGSGVDPEWFSDLYPGDSKPGPKKKS